MGGVLFSLPAVAVSTPTRGANVPWIEYEAEDGATNGEILGPSREIGNPATECCGRRGVKLTAAGQYVEIKAQKKANAIVVRYCIPDAPTGNGIDATVSMYVNGKHRQDLAVTSHHSWLYGTESVSSNTPGDGIPNRMFDECHALVGTIPAGATVRLQKDDGDTAAYYIVDLIDLEWVKPPLKKPSGFLSVTDFGATPNDTTDDAAAIEKCIAEAKAQQKGVWLPAGTFIQSHSIAASDVTVRGAGMWYTMLLHPESSPRVGGKIGFNVVNNARFFDFAIFGGAVHRDDGGNAFGGTFGTGTVIERVWME
ncbi:MAG TPA: glycosyl hydrolase family 28-related protein, partial [Armatimonadota bacterium]|nr:glycosyl hydrolase family 28-related protein [Armatimonadota bacterium]